MARATIRRTHRSAVECRTGLENHEQRHHGGVLRLYAALANHRSLRVWAPSLSPGGTTNRFPEPLSRLSRSAADGVEGLRDQFSDRYEQTVAGTDPYQQSKWFSMTR